MSLWRYGYSGGASFVCTGHPHRQRTRRRMAILVKACTPREHVHEQRRTGKPVATSSFRFTCERVHVDEGRVVVLRNATPPTPQTTVTVGFLGWRTKYCRTSSTSRPSISLMVTAVVVCRLSTLTNPLLRQGIGRAHPLQRCEVMNQSHPTNPGETCAARLSCQADESAVSEDQGAEEAFVGAKKECSECSGPTVTLRPC